MFNYPGSKYHLAKHYPAPMYDTIIEPFAGSAQYSFLHWRKRVILIDLNPDIIALWHRLQRASVDEILALPTFGDSELIVHEDPAFRFLITLGLAPSTSLGKQRAGTGNWITHWPGKRKKIAEGLGKIRHWEIIEGDYYSRSLDIRATWFIDPPYQYGVTYSCPRLDYIDLAEWTLTRKGQIIVCEQSDANWLPFHHLYGERYNGYAMGRSVEMIYHRHNFHRNQGDISPTYGHGKFWPG